MSGLKFNWPGDLKVSGSLVLDEKEIKGEEIVVKGDLNGFATKEEFGNYSTKEETEALVTEKITEIVADAPEDFDTLKEMSDWLINHEESAAAMNSAINKKLDNTTKYALSDSVGGSALKAVADENGENIAENFNSLRATIGDIQTVLATVVEVNEEGV